MASNVIELLIKAQDLASDKLKKVSKASSDMSDALVPVKRGFEVAAIAIGAAGVASIKMAADYEQSLNVFQSVSGATAKQMALVSEKARQLGKDASLPGISAANAAQAMTELAKAGLSVNDTLAASKGVLSLAKAGNIEVADAATIAAQALNAFGLKGREASRVADVLSAAANASASDVADLALGLQQSAAVAHTFGVSLNDTATTLALFANRGIRGSDAGTSLKTMLIALANPSRQASDAMEKIGLKAYDAQGKFVGMRQLALNLKDSLKGLTQQQQNQALATIFGTDAFRAASFLADSAGKSYDNMSKAVGRSGAAADLAKAQNSGFKGALDNLRSTVETMATDIGIKLLPPLTQFIKNLSNSSVFDATVKNINSILIVLGMLAGTFVSVKVGMFIIDLVKVTKAFYNLSSVIISTTAKVVVGGAKMIATAVSIAAKWVAQAAIASAAWIRDMAQIVASGAITATKMTIHAIATSAVWVKNAAIASAAWVINELPKIIAVGSVVAAKAAIHAADTGTAWVLNAIRVSFVWVTQEMPKLVASFAVVSASAVKQAAVTSAVWVKQAAVTSFVWITTELPKIAAAFVVTSLNALISAGVTSAYWVASAASASFSWVVMELPKIVAGFVATSISALFNASGTSAAWVASAATTSFAWVVQVLPKIIAAFVSMAGSAVLQAAISSRAWVVAAVKSSASYAAFAALVGTPLVMPAIAVAAAIGALSLVMKAVSAVQGAIQSMNDLAQAQANNRNASKDLIAASKKALAAGRISKAQYDKNMKIANQPVPDVSAFDKLLTGKFASGTPSIAGGLSMVGERGPELAALPTGTRVMNATETRQAIGGGKGATVTIEGGLHIHNEMDEQRFLRDLGWRLAL